MVPPMRLFPLLTLSIAPCGVLGWYGTQKLMAEPLTTINPDSPSVNTADSQAIDPVDGAIESQPMVDVQPSAASNQPKFSSLPKASLSKNIAIESQHAAPVTQQAIQGNFSLSVTTNHPATTPAPTTIDRNKIRQVVSQSTQSTLAALSLGQSTPLESAVVAPEIAEVLTEELTEIGIADTTDSVQTEHMSLEVATTISEPPLMPAASPEVTTQLQSEQSLVNTAQSSDNVSIGQSEVRQSELLTELTQTDLGQSTTSAAETSAAESLTSESLEIESLELETESLETEGSETESLEIESLAAEISESSILQPLFDSDVTQSNLALSQGVPHIVAQQVSAPALSPFVDENYILGPGDVISVNVFNVPDYSGQYSIAADGSITLPQLGRVLIHSMTMQQASDEIAARYAFTLESPLVSIQVVQQRPVQVAIAGEIIQPGLYTVSPQGTPYPRLFTALQQAGGITQAADIKQVEVRRRTANGGQTTLRVDLFALLNDGDISQNIFLQDGDTIMIPAATIVDMDALDQLSASNLRNNVGQPIDVAIVGEVNQPGPYRLTGEDGPTTVVQALQQAGGITPSANLRDVQLRRQTRQGGDQFFEVNLWELLQTGDLSQDLVLQQGDTLVVPTAPDTPIAELTAFTASTLSTGTIEANVLGEVESPGSQQVRANTSLNQAILSAGGLNRRTQGKVTLIRFNPDGTVSQQPIKIDLSQEINEETNPILRPNDVILVGRSARAAFEDTFNDLSGTFNLLLPLLLLGL